MKLKGFMKVEFIKESALSSRLILIFPGWSCDASLYKNIRLATWDIAVVEGYDSLEFPVDTIDNYSTVYLFAWSLGVAFASSVDFGSKITAAFAINGTLYPSHNSLGIPENIFSATAQNLTPLSLKKFRRRMAGDKETYRTLFEKDFTDEECLRLRDILFQAADLHTVSVPLPWKRAFISREDAIFPFLNMKNAWQKEGVEIIELPGSHYADMQMVISLVIPDTDKVSRRFSRSSLTYDSQALVQKRMAANLCELIFRNNDGDYRRILEIGQGTGLLTSEYLAHIDPEHIDFVDISSARPKQPKCSHEFHNEDAENWIERCDNRYDAVFSSATVQWFVNFPRFISNCARCLNPDGILAFSTFLPGNLVELDEFRPTPLHYLSEEEIRGILLNYFPDVECHSEKVTLEFDSPIGLLRHLKETGVAGSADGRNGNGMKIRNVRSLTYNCGYFIARLSKSKT